MLSVSPKKRKAWRRHKDTLNWPKETSDCWNYSAAESRTARWPDRLLFSKVREPSSTASEPREAYGVRRIPALLIPQRLARKVELGLTHEIKSAGMRRTPYASRPR